MEEKSIALYTHEAETVRDGSAQKAYAFLIEEEHRHYHQLRDHWERIAGTAFEEAADREQ
jgi:rubrerythrin